MKKSNRFYSFTIDESTLKQKLTPQIVQIFGAILKSGDFWVRGSWFEKISWRCEKRWDFKNSTIELENISYYRANMISEGFLQMRSEEIKPEVETSQVVNA